MSKVYDFSNAKPDQDTAKKKLDELLIHRLKRAGGNTISPAVAKRLILESLKTIR